MSDEQANGTIGSHGTDGSNGGSGSSEQLVRTGLTYNQPSSLIVSGGAGGNGGRGRDGQGVDSTDGGNGAAGEAGGDGGAGGSAVSEFTGVTATSSLVVRATAGSGGVGGNGGWGADSPGFQDGGASGRGGDGGSGGAGGTGARATASIAGSSFTLSSGNTAFELAASATGGNGGNGGHGGAYGLGPDGNGAYGAPADGGTGGIATAEIAENQISLTGASLRLFAAASGGNGGNGGSQSDSAGPLSGSGGNAGSASAAIRENVVNGSDSSENITIDLIGDRAFGGSAGAYYYQTMTGRFGTSDATRLKLTDNDILTGGGDDSLTINISQRSGGAFDFQGNVLDGGDGIDTLTLDGDAVYGIQFDLRANTITGFERIQGSDWQNFIIADDSGMLIYGLAGNDTLTGGGGADLLDGGSGEDRLVGGLGNDTYVVDSQWDTVTETQSGGTDTVHASIDYTLGSHFENLVLVGTGSGSGFGNGLDNDLTGNELHNLLVGRSGNDRLYGGDGSDRLYGEEGDDILDGGAGNDAMEGGVGNDVYYVDADGDQTTEYGGQGVDTVRNSITHTLAGNIENMVLQGAGDIDGTGNELANVITGNAGENVLNGASGNDTLDGGTGNDVLDGVQGDDYLIGGLGDDTFHVDSASDMIEEWIDEGKDAVVASVSYSLAFEHLEKLTLTGTANLKGEGNGLANILIGNAGNNVLDGSRGNDTIDGGAGADLLIGGLGDDIFIIDNSLDRVRESDETGIDVVEASVSFSLAGQYVENLTLKGSGNINGIGNGLDNEIAGNDGDNKLRGGDGNDTLDGGGGVDALYGQVGDDIYVITDGADKAFEKADQGSDAVVSSVSYSIAGQYIEDLHLTGEAAINGTGNNHVNTLYGNGASNQLRGMGGDDYLIGGGGDDTLSGGEGSDVFGFQSAPGSEGVDRITDFESGIDQFVLDRGDEYGFGGTLSEEELAVEAEAQDANDRIIYNKATGQIFSDVDGAGGADQILFATVAPATVLLASDFYAFSF